MDSYSLKSVFDLPAPFRSCFSFRYFNSLQSECFPICFHSDVNMIISAPTGSGKTVLFELCLLRLLSRFISAEGRFVHVYIAPSKALVQEKLRDWNQKFGPWGMNCLELTGDNEFYTSRNIHEADIILTTPEGYHGDTSKTFCCGEVSDEMKNLVKVSQECLEKGIAVCKDGVPFRKIGKRISEHAEKYGYSVVERFVGHGVGKVFHSEPIIYHHRNNKTGCMIEGQTFTIEPILTLGSIDSITWPDNWTAVTADGSPAAQFEHTILITRTGAEILTC